jgi:hypothetical protein
VRQHSRVSSAQEFFSRLSPRSGHKEEPRTRSWPAKTIFNFRYILGRILRGYRMPMMRHFLLTGALAKARGLLRRLVSGDPRSKLETNGLRGG